MSDTSDRPKGGAGPSSVLRPFVEPERLPLPDSLVGAADATVSDAPVSDAPVSDVADQPAGAAGGLAPASTTREEVEPMAVAPVVGTPAEAPSAPATPVAPAVTEAPDVSSVPGAGSAADVSSVPGAGSAADVSSVPGAGSAAVPAPPPAPPAPASTGGSGVAGTLPDASPSGAVVSLPRTAFLVGLGTMLLVIVGLVLLWRTAGGDDPSAAPIAATDQPATSAPSVTTAGDGDAAALEAETSRADAAESRASELEGRVGDLEGQVSELQDRLAAQPVPALPASWLDRTIVATDAQFVSGNDVGIAVVGQFGGYANIDPVTGVITATGQIADGASRVLRTDSAAWATNYEGNEVLRVDPVTNQVVASIAFPSPDGLAKDGGTLIVASFDGGFVGRVDPGLAETTQQVDVGGNATAVLVTEAGRIFAAVFDTGEVVEIDPTTFTVLDRWIVGNGPVGLAPDGDVIWVSNRREGTVVALDLTTGEVGEAVAVGQGPTEVAVAFGSVWVAVTDAGDLVEVDPGTLTVVTRTPLGGAPTGLTVSGGSLWVGMAGDQSVVRVTPR